MKSEREAWRREELEGVINESSDLRAKISNFTESKPITTLVDKTDSILAEIEAYSAPESVPKFKNPSEMLAKGAFTLDNFLYRQN